MVGYIPADNLGIRQQGWNHYWPTPYSKCTLCSDPIALGTKETVLHCTRRSLLIWTVCMTGTSWHSEVACDCRPDRFLTTVSRDLQVIVFHQCNLPISNTRVDSSYGCFSLVRFHKAVRDIEPILSFRQLAFLGVWKFRRSRKLNSNYPRSL